jgi:hypothetical protein
MDSGENTRLLPVFSSAKHLARPAESAARPAEPDFAIAFFLFDRWFYEMRENLAQKRRSVLFLDIHANKFGFIYAR